MRSGSIILALILATCAAGDRALAAVASRTGSPAPPTAESLTDLSLGELMKIRVTSVAKAEQPLSQAPAAITVLTQEDLRRSGAISIPEALRMVPGLVVARIDSNKWAISSRDSNNRFSNKLLVLIDSRVVYTPIFGGVFWDIQDTMLEDVDRIEVIRGPGAALWGANAVEGVINILTRPASDTQGGLGVLGGGGEEQRFGRIRYGGKLGDRARYRVWAKADNRDNTVLPAGVDGHDAWDAERGGFRVDWDRSDRDSICVQSDLYHENALFREEVVSRRRPPTEILDNGIRASGGYIRVHWKRTGPEDSGTDLRLYHDANSRLDEQRFEDETYDLDFQRHGKLASNHSLVWGLGYRQAGTRSLDTFPRALVPADFADRVLSGFVQDRITTKDRRLELTLASRFEHNSYTGFEVQPTARLRWSPTDRRTVWAAVSRAVQTPTRLRAHIVTDSRILLGRTPTVITVLGNPQIRSEELIAGELGFREQASARLAFDVALFHHRIDEGLGLHAEAPFRDGDFVVRPLRLDNSARAAVRGGEVAVSYAVDASWKLTAGYSRQDVDFDPGPGGALPNRSSPTDQLNLRSYWNVTRRVELDALLYGVAPVLDGAVNGYWRADLHLGWRAAENLVLTLVGQNLLDDRHPEFIDARIGPPARDLERSVHAQVMWRF